MMVDGRFAFLNKYAISLFGAKDAEKLIGTPVIERFHSDYRQSVLEQIEILIKEKKPVPLSEEKIIRLDGSVLDIDINAVPIHFNQIDAGLVFARDVSERKRLEETQKAMEAQLREQQKLEAIGTLAAGVAHEINNPINGIMNYAQLILDSKELSDSQTEYTREIIRETERVSNIVKNLLQFSRQEKQSHSFASVYDIVNKTTSLINTLIKKDQIELDIQLEENLPNIKCRSQQIQQVLMNLLTNARDALNERYRSYSPGKIIRLSANKFSVNGEKWIRIVVEDHGNGIPQAVLDKIFNPFFSTKDKDKGTGLGLSISFGIIKEHNGKIRVDTKEGAYSKFIIELPCDNGWKISDAE
jgi:PAS domain S-box-containing protein